MNAGQRARLRQLSQLSVTQQATLEVMRAHGDLVRSPGGFWTWQGCPSQVKAGDNVPDWYVPKSTIDALFRRDLVVVTERLESGAPKRVRLK
jgi:hypothetical protein